MVILVGYKFNQKLLSIYVIKKLYFLCVYVEMVDISKETHGSNDIEVIVDCIDTLWLNEKHVEEKLGHKIYQSSQTNIIQYVKSTDVNW